jgi:hypothetical protein
MNAVVPATTTTTDGKSVGRPVENTEIFAFADQKCRTCWGKGYIHGTRTNKAGQWYRYATQCKCAMWAFHKKNPTVIVDPKTGQIFWAPDPK